MNRRPRFLSLLAVTSLLVGAVGLPVSSALAQAGYAASHYAAQRATPYPMTQEEADYQLQMASYQQQMAAYQGYYQQAPAAVPVARAELGALVRFDGQYAEASGVLPIQVQYAVNAANYLQNRSYQYGGGHRNIESSSYDCSSAVSYALIKGGMLRGPLTSKAFANFGAPGQGRFITIWVKPGEHVFMTVCGLRLDTTGGREREGPRWRTQGRSMAGFTPRHPVGM